MWTLNIKRSTLKVAGTAGGVVFDQHSEWNTFFSSLQPANFNSKWGNRIFTVHTILLKFINI